MAENTAKSEITKAECQKTRGQLAYEQDCRIRPTYDRGEPRKSWDQLSAEAKWSWERNPTSRHWVFAAK